MNRHRLDVLSLVFGIAFVLMATAFALPVDVYSTLARFDLGWLPPLALILLGVVMVARLVGRATNELSHVDEQDEETEETPTLVD